MVETRHVSSDDLDFLWSMLFYAARADDEPGATMESIRLDPHLDRYLSGWGRSGDLGLVAMSDGEAVGAGWLRLFTSDETHLATYVDADIPELAIAIEPRWIGQGIGSLLLGELLGQADEAKVPGIVLSARADNPAVRLYERHGFIETDRIVSRVGTESVKMVRTRAM